MRLLRTKEGYERYEAYKKKGGLEGGCALCEVDSVKDFEYWRIIENEFPYDRIAESHDMLVPKRHIKEPEFNEDEKKELLEIKSGEYVSKNYHFIIEATKGIQSIPAHFHLHLTKIKE